ncbi:hypothetical protein [Estrella lausannensis]|uniref:Uncharacterized protein n=1 Tax=Estrella lausannensis TaxID=483423 RepID=A0A0H5DNN7_9BACT|nr:hypothetical protein [Estrella lausannensis]CRX37408.1 hypothetical protein ELAC_0044 [Estrella lausannensis]
MTLSPQQLSANLQELYYEAHVGGQPELVPSLFSNHVYSSGSGFGRFWKVIYAVIGFFFGHGLKNERLKTVLMKVVQSYQQFQKEIEPVFKRYQTLIGERCEGYESRTDLYKNLRWQIHHWNDRTMPFVKLILKRKTAKVEQLIRTYFSGENIEAPEESGNPFIFPSTKEIASYQRLIDLEELSEDFYPYYPLAKLAMEKPLTKTEEQELGDWIERVESLEVKQKKLRRSLEALIHNISAMNSSPVAKEPSLVLLEIELLKRGLNTLTKEDPKHIEWRKTLKKGDTVPINGTPYTLGEEIRYLKSTPNQNLVFLCREREDAVVVIGKNLSTLEIRRQLQRDVSSGLVPPTWIEIGEDGKAALQERMLKHISQIEWKSSHELKQADNPFLRPFIGLIRFMVQIEKTPKNIPFEYLYFSRDCILKCIKPTQLVPFDYGSLELLALYASKKNQVIFNTIVTKSSLFQYGQRRFFEDIISTFEQEGNLSPKAIASLSTHMITNSSVIDRGEALSESVRTLFKRIEKKIHLRYQVEDPDALKKAIRRHIRIRYNAEKARSFFFPKFSKRVMNQIQGDLRLQLKEGFSF